MTAMIDRAAVLFLIAALAACAPRVYPASEPVGPPALLDDHLRMADGARLPLRVWRPDGPPKAIILALHGFNDYSHAFEDPGRFWAARGIVTYAYDQRGFGDAPHRGKWAGVDTMAGDLLAAGRLLRERHPGLPLILLGESMGGSVIMTALARADGPLSDGAVLSAPAVWSREVMPLWQRAALYLLAHTMPYMTATGSGFGKKPSDNIEMLRKLGRDPKVIKDTRFDAIYGLVNLMDAALAAAPKLKGRVLLLYGKKEDIIPDRARRVLEKKLPTGQCDLRMAEYDTGYHMLLRDLKAERVLTDVAAWISDADAPLPSGAGRRFAAAPADAKEGDGASVKLALNCALPARTARP